MKQETERCVASHGRPILWWSAVILAVLVGVVARAWNLDWDERQHLHPDERHWSLVSAELDRVGPEVGYPTVVGPVLTWLDGQRSPANAYRGDTTTFVYGPTVLAVSRTVAGWLHDGAATGAQPANAVVHAINALGIPVLDDDGNPRFDAGYQVDLVGRLLGALLDAATIVVVAIAGRRLGGPLAAATGIGAAWFAAGTVLFVQHAHFFGAEPALGLTSALCVLALLHVDRGDATRLAVRSGLFAGGAAGAVVAVKFSGLGLAIVPFGLLGGLAVVRRRRMDLIRFAAAVLGGAIVFRVLCPSAFVGLGWRPNPIFWDDLQALRRTAGSDFPPAIQWANRTPVFEATWWLTKFTLGPALTMAGIVGLVMLWRARGSLGRWVPTVLVASVVVPYAFVFRDQVTSGRYFIPMVPALTIAAGFAVATVVSRLEQASLARQRIGVGFVTCLLILAAVWPIAFLKGVHGVEHTRIRASEWIALNIPVGSTLTAEAWDDRLPLSVRGVDPEAYESVQLNLFGTDDVAKAATLARQLDSVDYVVESSPRVWHSVVRIPARYPSTISFFDALDDGRLGFERVATFSGPPSLGPLRLVGGEEPFSVYDHPEVRIWKRTHPRSAVQMFEVLDPVAAASAMPVHPGAASTNGAMLTAGEISTNDARGTFADDFAESGLLSNEVLQTLMWIAVLAAIAAATWTVMLPVFRRLPDAGVGLSATLGIATLIAASVAGTGWLGLPYGRRLSLGLVGAWWLLGGLAGWHRRCELAELVRQRWRTMSVAIAVGVVGFVGATLLRALDPDLWHPSRGGEKPFELAMLTSVLRARTIPPPDAWFAGGAVNYHYGGSLMVSVPARVARTSPELAMNLGIGMITMLITGTAFSAGAALATLRFGVASRSPGARVQTVARRAGLLAVGFVVLVPNLALVAPVVNRARGLEHGAFDWWALSRVVPDSPVVTEFPAWSITFGDLHGHLLGLPIVLLTATLLVVLATCESRAGALITAVLVGLVVGMSRAVNSWDFPLTTGATAVVITLIAATTSWRRAVWIAVAATVAAVVVWYPFTSRVDVGSPGFEFNDIATPLRSFLLQWGLWALMTVVAVSIHLAGRGAKRPWSSLTARHGTVPIGVAIATVGLAIGAALVAGAGFVLAAALSTICAATVALSARNRMENTAVDAPTAAFVALTLGWGILAMVEVVVFRNDFERMNTVFKWWFHAWALIAVGSAAAIATAFRRAPGRHRVWLPAATALLAVAALLAGSFAAAAVPARLDDRLAGSGLSLDGLAFLDSDLIATNDDGTELRPGDDRALIDWFRATVVGLPTIIEAPGQGYRWVGRVAGLTGVPTVLGWPYHESQQRPGAGDAVSARERDLEVFFLSSEVDARLDVLWRRDVDYVVFGAAELALAGDDGARSTRELPCINVVFDRGPMFVAAVDRSCLEPRALAWSLDHN